MEQRAAEQPPRIRARVPAQGSAEAGRARHPADADGAQRLSAAPASGGTRADAEPAALTHAVPAPRPAAPVRKPQRHSVRAQVLAALREALLSGELTPGAVYSAPALAESFGVSPTPVREAMQQLAVEGAVEVVPNRGFRVAERTPRDLAELAEVRAMLEVPAVLRLARTLPPERWEELRPQAAATVTAAGHGDCVAYAEADRAFHRALLALTGNRQLALVADDLHRRTVWPCGGAAVGVADLLADAADHMALLDALAAQDPALAERIIRDHLTGARFPH
ncbi:GntR family transcriptional regulator [Streptomyces sp. Ru73]|uniref:GntR family transcriptional regulator n=1 Tax=Streptomyces sp. Ru73 TaxID=2080748 RepID=UPI000CDD8ADC|nr:GntR family transcriptional regulator [Streptomyces sp. Ru73]POX37312.1 GntR family transcriptional regulator [Streptomyces sp. Ru73]